MINVAVIIINYNSEQLLIRCLESLAKQTTHPAEIIIVDNGGQQKLSFDFEKRYLTTMPITVIRLDKNIGFAGANNLAVKAVGECEWIALLNPDAFPEPDWLTELLLATKQYPDFSFFGSHMLSAEDPTVLDGTADVYHVSGRPWRQDYGCRVKKIQRIDAEIFSPCAAAALYRRDVFLANMGFDEHYFCYLEDIDLGFRLRLAGHRCLYVSKAVVHHIGSATTRKNSDFYVYHGQRNLVWTYVKNMPPLLFWLYLPQHLLLNLWSLVWFIRQSQGKVLLKAKWDALRGLKRVWHQRQATQRVRKVSSWQLRKLMATGWPFASKK